MQNNPVTDQGVRILSGILRSIPTGLKRVDVPKTSIISPAFLQQQLTNHKLGLKIKPLGLPKLNSFRNKTLDVSNWLVEDYFYRSSFKIGLNGTYSLAAFSPHYVAVQGESYSIAFFDIRFGSCVSTLEGHTHFCWSLLAFSNNQLLSGSLDKTVRLWDLNTKRCVKIFNQGSAVSALAKIDEKYFVSGSKNGEIKIWRTDLDESACVCVLKEHTRLIAGLVIWPELMASASADGTIRLWDIKDLSNVHCIHIFRNAGVVYKMVGLANGMLASCAYNQSEIRLWNTKKRTEQKWLIGHQGGVYALKDLKNNILATGGSDKKIILWEIEQGRYLTTLATNYNNPIEDFEIFPDGTLLSVAKPAFFLPTDNTVLVWKRLPRLLELRDIEPWLSTIQINNLCLDNLSLGHNDIRLLMQGLKLNPSITHISLKNTGLTRLIGGYPKSR